MKKKTRRKRKSPLYANRYCGIASKKGVRMSMYGTFNLFATILVAVVYRFKAVSLSWNLDDVGGPK